MAKRVTLDAMIAREDFALEAEDVVLEILFGDFPISNLIPESPILKARFSARNKPLEPRPRRHVRSEFSRQ